VPAGAVIQRPQALPEITGRKGCVGGVVSPFLNLFRSTEKLEGKRQCSRMYEVCRTHSVGVKSVDIVGNTECEGSTLGHS
jgi:hypothetical protein